MKLKWGGQGPTEKVILSKDLKEGRKGAAWMSGGRRVTVLTWECLRVQRAAETPVWLVWSEGDK